jgi:hypothetical protein
MPDKPFGGSNPRMYLVHVAHPTTLKKPYDAECNDLMEALDMTPAEANIFKAVWRIAQARKGKAKPGAGGVYDAHKINFFAKRVLVREQNEEDKSEST